jgi:hypothetical protein
MKKLVMTAIAAVALPALVVAQGTVSFTTSDFTNHRFLLQDLSAAPAGTLASLWWSPDNIVPYTQIAANTVTVNGWITAGVTATTGAATAPGASAWFYVRGENGALVGVTPNFENPTANPNTTPPGTPADLTGWTSPVILVPEPSTLALAGLGMGALLLFRRRK